ncbi:uncharacterized protein [Misgurnus anguillicaudatus]|uniref:uncharacterized protein n=1 Tax=Misgurnus anguillicaudatus TaxID=75329 RepID=UPI003CCF04CD
MRGATVVLLALLTGALNPCCRAPSLGDAERHNVHRGVNVNRAFTHAASHETMACKGFYFSCFVEKYSTSMKNLKVITVQFFSICPVICFCELLNEQELDGQHIQEPNQNTECLHEVTYPSSSYCLMYAPHFKPMDSYFFYLTGRGNISDSSRTNGLNIIYELNVKTHARRMNCVCFIKVDIFMSENEQMNITEKLWMRTGAWFVSSNFTNENPKFQGLTMLLQGMNVIALICTSPRLTDCCSVSCSICVSATMHCKCVPSLHRSVCVTSLMGENSDSCFSCADIFQFIHIWTYSLQQQSKFNHMTKSCFRSAMFFCKDQKESPAQRQICTQLLNIGLFHQWIMRVLLMIVSMFFVGQRAVRIYISYKQRLTCVHRNQNSNLSFLLLFTVSWCSLNPLTVTGQSTGCSCKLHHTAFGITFVLCITCVVGKTIVVLLAFKVISPGSNVYTFIIIIIDFVFWFSIHSSCFNIIMNWYQDKTLECYGLLAVGFCFILRYLLLTLILTFLVCTTPFKTTCYTILNVHGVMRLMTGISLKNIFRPPH